MTTMTQPLEISILSAPVAAIDRRALSQAWYSVLGLARRGRDASATTCSGRSGAPSNGCTPGISPRSRYGSTSLEERSFEFRILRSPKKLEFLREQRRNDSSAPLNRRPGPSTLAARIGRKLEARAKRATVQIDGDRGRVHLIVQNVGTRMRIIAICPNDVKARVARAIDEARYALAARGVITELSVKGASECK
jgi:hypothetical protein